MTLEQSAKRRLAEQIAKAIFSVSDSKHKCQRIQLKGGRWPDETDMGGLCKSALEKLIFEELTK